MLNKTNTPSFKHQVSTMTINNPPLIGSPSSTITKNKSPYLCYLIALGERCTYIGVTNDFGHRIRQHNGLIKGGAKYTTSRGKISSESWVPIIHVTGFPSYRAALQFEWKWKNLTKQIRNSISNSKRGLIAGRLQALNQLLGLKRVTKNSIPTDFENLAIKWQIGANYIDMLVFHTLRPCLIKLKPKLSVNNENDP